ncbi:DUF6242 domain-containing protein [Proteiniphilum sp. X52]|uniref:DUF6242 domain-containing protein n=1 Tax=Proteiniphilum sp. X52 TaxID=2382159 RepID=UPI000F0A31EE|nr:DUF6242 domain-containing protein [Proteiniphilum sp. X52]RNC64199.1 hypothetical protein D7D25_12540 [Proteiniphilum sp. X52]
MEYPTDPQIYAISLTSKTDTTNLLPGVVFTIDQVNGKLYNKEPLPYGFHVDSAMLKLTGSTSWAFSMIDLTLDPDSTYAWNASDSISIARLRKIKTTAPDGVTSKNYDFQLNIYQEDPYILIWGKIAGNYLGSPVENQTTIIYNNRFYTYYKSGEEMKAVSTAISETPQWGTVNLSGIPHTLRLSSLIVSGDIIYALDAATGTVYRSTNGADWSWVQTEYEVKALYGELPSSTPGNILLAVSHDEKIKFARANNHLSDMVLMNDTPANIPVTDFSSIKVESSTSYASKFIFLSGGATTLGTSNDDIWLLQEDGGVIKYIRSKRPAEGAMKGSSLFFYDDKPYLIATSAGKNLLMYSDNYGVDWITAGENQSFPADFAGRTYPSVVTDANNNIWIFGGISSSNTPLVDIWKGRLNKFALN